jgi:hypothetical protein
MRLNPDRLTISRLITELQEVMAHEGDLVVVYEGCGEVILGIDELDGHRVLDLAAGDYGPPPWLALSDG